MSRILLSGLLALSQTSAFSPGDNNTPPNLKVRAATSFPIIYVGQGLVDCGAPLVKDQCSTYPVNYSITTGQLTFAVHAPYLYSINATYPIVANNPIITIPIDGYLALQGTYQTTITHDPPATRVVVATSYSPTISQVLPTTGTATVSTPQPQITVAPNIPRNIQPVKRSFEYDICQGQPPTWRLLTKSLTEVCHFVANAQDYFVSLKPSSDAAYLPSWISYLFQFLLCVMYFFCMEQAFFQDTEVKRSRAYFAWSIAINTLSLCFSLLRTTLAIMTLSRHGGNWPSLPLISPIIWLDMATIYAITGYIHPVLSFLSLISTILLYFVSFWLTIGYGHLGYGTQQYQILHVPYFCVSSPDVDFRTDPRRGNFVCLHVVQFVLGTLSLLISLPGIYRGPTPAKEALQRPWKWIMIAGFTLPLWIGIVIAAADHSKAYVLLNQGVDTQCFSSFASGWIGYADCGDVSWLVKVSTMIGLNT